MSVRKIYRGSGIAQHLLDKVKNHAAKPIFEDETSASCIVLSTSTYRQAALKCYGKAGFKQLALLKEPLFFGSYGYAWYGWLEINPSS